MLNRGSSTGASPDVMIVKYDGRTMRAMTKCGATHVSLPQAIRDAERKGDFELAGRLKLALKRVCNAEAALAASLAVIACM